MKKIYFLILLVLSLTSCADASMTQDRLDMPVNVIVDKNTITFDPVLNATSYIINLLPQETNEAINHVITDTTYTIEESGTYNVRIRAQAPGYADSLFSIAVEVEVRYLSYPENIRIQNYQLHFDDVQDATSYIVEVNGEAYVFPVDFRYYPPGTYNIRVRAISDRFVDSVFSPEQVVISAAPVNTSGTYYYSSYSNFDLPVYMSQRPIQVEHIQFDGELLATSAYYVSNNVVYIRHRYLEQLDFETSSVNAYDYYIIIRTEEGTHSAILKVNDDNRPYLYTNASVYTDFVNDVVFKYDLLEGEFVGMGSGIAEDDYRFEDGTLTISIDYILGIFAENPNRDNIILTSELRDDQGTILVYLRIRRT